MSRHDARHAELLGTPLGTGLGPRLAVALALCGLLWLAVAWSLS